jgi:hypothetical protein
MIAPLKPELLLVKFLFTAPCLFASLTITCEATPAPKSSTFPTGSERAGNPPVDPQAAPAPSLV